MRIGSHRLVRSRSDFVKVNVLYVEGVLRMIFIILLFGVMSSLNDRIISSDNSQMSTVLQEFNNFLHVNPVEKSLIC